MSEWISVEERLPELGEKVDLYSVVCGRLTDWYMDHASASDKTLFWRDGRSENPSWTEEPITSRDITHWMPLPDPPEGEK